MDKFRDYLGNFDKQFPGIYEAYKNRNKQVVEDLVTFLEKWLGDNGFDKNAWGINYLNYEPSIFQTEIFSVIREFLSWYSIRAISAPPEKSLQEGLEEIENQLNWYLGALK